jgi:hypothetical protein
MDPSKMSQEERRMTTNIFKSGVMLGIVLLLSAGSAKAQNDYATTPSDDEANSKYSYQSVAAEYAADLAPQPEPEAAAASGGGSCNSCNSCNSGSCNSGCNTCCTKRFKGAFADPCPRVGWYVWSGADSWRGVTSGSFQGNNGVVNGFNMGAYPLAFLEDLGIGVQAGGSYNLYNFSGNDSFGGNNNEATQQMFYTIGLFRRADVGRPLSAGFVYDGMMSNNLGVYATSPYLSQFRGQVAWATSAWNEFGFWGTFHGQGASRNIPGAPGTGGTGQVNYRTIDQINLFWHHKWARGGADSWFYVGIPERDRLSQDSTQIIGGTHSLGAFIAGGNFLVPISNRVSMYSNAFYMKPTAHASASASTQDFWNIGMGLQFTGRSSARSSTVAGRKSMPYMNVANNSNFLIDTNSAF